jgi:hypothetical protein
VIKLNCIAGLAAALMLAATGGVAWAQSSGASPADPNNERNQTPAPSNAQPADPAAGNNPFPPPLWIAVKLKGKKAARRARARVVPCLHRLYRQLHRRRGDSYRHNCCCLQTAAADV